VGSIVAGAVRSWQYPIDAQRVVYAARGAA
jgi:hypothetical protein